MNRAVSACASGITCSHGTVGRSSVRSAGAWLQLPTYCCGGVSPRRLRQSETAATDHAGNAEDIFHYHGDRLHKLATTLRERLRKDAGRRNDALSTAQGRKGLFLNRRRSAWPEGPAIRGESRHSSS